MNFIKATLVGRTVPLIEGINNTEEFIAYVARVSNPANQQNSQTAPNLLKYLLKNKHWSPFEMASLVIEVETPRDIGRQLLRHRSFSFQEFSQRYANVESLGFITREARLQDAKNRQASLETEDVELDLDWRKLQLDILDNAAEAYKWALDKGIAKEQARVVLPEGLTMSKLYVSGTVRSWIHYCQVRTDIATQKEHRVMAEACLEVIKKELPSIVELL